MTSPLLQDPLLESIVQPLLNAFFHYGLPALALCAVLSFISARLSVRKRRQRNRQRQARQTPPIAMPASGPLPVPQSAPPPLSSVPVRARRPLTPYEEQMYGTLRSALPECVILAQVAFSALITTDEQADRNRFDRKVADFVICSRQLTPIAVIELDDRSHRNKQSADADRDAMLRNAGYRTLRYQGIPPAEHIRRDIEMLLVAMTMPPPATELHYL